MAGYVYVIENENHKVKIGRSINPEKRIKHIELISGYKIINTYVTPKLHQYSQLETFLHDYFVINRSIGEWFDIKYCDAVSYIKKLNLCKWNTNPPHKESPDHERLIKQIIFDPILKAHKEIRDDECAAIKDKVNTFGEYLCKKDNITKEYVENLYDQIDVLHSKLIYLQEQGVKINFPESPKYDEDNIILEREDIMEEYDSIG